MRMSQVTVQAGLVQREEFFLLFLLATDEACLPRAVRTDFGKCAIVRFLFALAAAFFTFRRAAFRCVIEAILFTPCSELDTPIGCESAGT